MSNIPTAREFVQVPVPAEYVSQVFGFIAALDAREEPGEAVELITGTLDASPEWTPELLRLQYKESPETMQKFLKIMAEHPDQDFDSDQIANMLGLPFGWNSLAGALGAYTRRLKNRYGMPDWPFAVSWDSNDRAHYSMSPKVAEVIQAL